MDAIAQEASETLSLELVPTATTTLPTGDGVFFRNTLNMSIVDSDSKILLEITSYSLISFLSEQLFQYLSLRMLFELMNQN